MYPFLTTDRARDTKSDEIVALKKVRMDKEKDGESTTSLAPINMDVFAWNQSIWIMMNVIIKIKIL